MPSAHDLREAGLQHFRAERLPAAATAFAEAAALYEAAGDLAAAAELRNNLCVVRMALNDWPGALSAVEGTPEIFARLNDPLRAAQAVANQAAAQDGAGNVEAAAALYLRAIEQLGALGEKDTRAACFKKLSALQIKLGQQMQALASMHSGLNLSAELSPKEKMLKEMIDKAVKLMGGSLPG